MTEFLSADDRRNSLRNTAVLSPSAFTVPCTGPPNPNGVSAPPQQADLESLELRAIHPAAILSPFERTALWVKNSEIHRLILVQGSCRLSTNSVSTGLFLTGKDHSHWIAT